MVEFNQDRRDLLNNAVQTTVGGVILSFLSLFNVDCTNQQRAVLVQNTGKKATDSDQAGSQDTVDDVVNKTEETYKPLKEMQGMFQYDIMQYGEVTASDKLAVNADYVGRAFASKQFEGKENKKLGLLALRYTNLVACSLVRDIPPVTNSVDLETIARLNIAETITSNGAAKKLIKKKRKACEKAYGRIDKSSDSEYDKIKNSILTQYKLEQVYKDCKDFGKRLLKFSGEVVDAIEPIDDIFYGLKHTDLPSTQIEDSKLSEKDDSVSDQPPKNIDQLYHYLRAEHKSSLVDVLQSSNIGTLEEAQGKKETGKMAYYFKLDVSAVEGKIAVYNNLLAGADLAYGQKVNTLINLALEKDKKIYTKAERTRLAMAGSRLKTGLAWKEKVEANKCYATFENTKDKKYLARAASHALAAYVLAADIYDQSVFRGILEEYKSQMKKLGVSKEKIREANVEVLFPYYLDELKERKSKAFWTSAWGGGRSALIVYSLAAGAAGAGGGGGAGAGGSVSIAGGFI